MTTAQLWLVLKAVIAILPAIVAAIREGRLKQAAMNDVIEAIHVNLDKRIERAKKARHDASKPDPNQRD